MQPDNERGIIMAYNFLKDFDHRHLLYIARYLENIPGRAEDNSDAISEAIRGIYKEMVVRKHEESS